MKREQLRKGLGLVAHGLKSRNRRIEEEEDFEYI
jgi:hypothetical protein